MRAPEGEVTVEIAGPLIEAEGESPPKTVLMYRRLKRLLLLRRIARLSRCLKSLFSKMRYREV